MKNEILRHCREVMAKVGATAALIPTSDPHGSEFIGLPYQLRQFISGFTGSAGTLLILMDKAYLWTDSRYHLQAQIQLKESSIELMRDGCNGVPSITDFLIENLSENDTLLYNPLLVSIEMAANLSDIKAALLPKTDIDKLLWMGKRPCQKRNPIYAYPIQYCGLSHETKVEKIRYEMSKLNCQYYFVSHLDENAWLHNLRGSDIENTPVFYSFSLITPNEVLLFIDSSQLEKTVSLDNSVIIKEYEDVWEQLSSLRNCNILMDPKTCCHLSYMQLHSSCHPVFKASIIDELKAIKNPTEQLQLKALAVDDGLAVSKVLMEIEKLDASKAITEYEIFQLLLNERKKIPDFKSVSFDTIAGFKENGAIIHYQPQSTGSKPIKGSGLLLIDSGGQYLRGTTDITRTVPIGKITPEMIRCYTAVLASHLALYGTIFHSGSCGKTLDGICRNRLAEFGHSYAHGTGHGCGHFLSVHEGPHGFSRGIFGEHEILPETCTTIEPGIYIEGNLGIRLENQVICHVSPNDKNYLYFQTVTLCPWERELIDPNLLSDDELLILNQYHELVKEKLSQATNDFHLQQWIEKKCQKITKG